MGLPWNRIFHELNLTPLINKMNELAQRVEQLASQIVTVNNPRITIKQGGVAKGSFTLNQASAKTIDLDAGGGGGGGTEYTAGNGITIQNNVISVTNPVSKLHIALQNVNIPCLKLTSEGITKQDGTAATLSDFIDLGVSNANLADYFFMKGQILDASGVYSNYDYMSQSYTDISFSDIDIYSNVASVYLGTENAVLSMFDSYVSSNLSFVIDNGGTPVYPSCYITIGKKNGHLYLGQLAQVYGADSPYLKSLHDDFAWDFIAF